MPSETTLNRTLAALIEHIASSDKPIIIDYRTSLKWQSGALELFLKLGLIKKASMAKSIECKGCDNHCFMDVITHTNKSNARAFIVCEDPEMQSQMGRMEISIEHLKQWESSIKQMAYVVSNLLDLDSSHTKFAKDKIQLGMLKSSMGRRWVSILQKPLSIEINQHTIPLNEILFFEGKELLIDELQINELLERPPTSTSNQYTQSTDKREEGKIKTQAMYQDWNDEYIIQKNNKPNASDTWISKKIAKMDISQGKSSEYIRKNMKN